MSQGVREDWKADLLHSTSTFRVASIQGWCCLCGSLCMQTGPILNCAHFCHACCRATSLRSEACHKKQRYKGSAELGNCCSAPSKASFATRKLWLCLPIACLLSLTHCTIH